MTSMSWQRNFVTTTLPAQNAQARKTLLWQLVLLSCMSAQSPVSRKHAADNCIGLKRLDIDMLTFCRIAEGCVLGPRDVALRFLSVASKMLHKVSRHAILW